MDALVIDARRLADTMAKANTGRNNRGILAPYIIREAIRTAGRSVKVLNDGRGLSLRVRKSGAQWQLQRGKQSITLGSYPNVSLYQARLLAQRNRPANTIEEPELIEPESVPELIETTPIRYIAVTLANLDNVHTRPATKLAFRFMILTASRFNEIQGATWQEINGFVWTTQQTLSNSAFPRRHGRIEGNARPRGRADIPRQGRADASGERI